MSLYVSDQLTHFAGAKLPNDEARYDLLRTILMSGTLLDGRLINAKRRPIFHFDIRERGGGRGRIDYFPEPYFELDESADPTSDDGIRPEMICLCDIPLTADHLQIHVAKYGRFGVAFKRTFIAENGGSPVTYIASSARTRVRAISYGELPDLFTRAEGKSLFTSGAERGEYIGQLRKRHLELVIERRDEGEREAERYTLGEIDLDTLNRRIVESLDYAVGSWAYIFGLHKRFDPALPEDDPNNYYMEREWRVLGTVKFRLQDVTTVIVPSAFESRLVTDFPALTGKAFYL